MIFFSSVRFFVIDVNAINPHFIYITWCTYKKPLKAVWPDYKAATYTEKTTAEKKNVTLKLEMFTVSKK